MTDDRSKCTGCGACVRMCDREAVSMTADGEGFLYPVIDETLCTHCGRCSHSCEIALVPAEPVDTGIAFRNSDSIVRAESSSGGAFGAIADAFWSRNPEGMVFGAAFNAAFRVVHIGVSRKEGIGPLHGSKYVESDLGDTLSRIAELLFRQVPVLFSGTPCQCSGVRKLFGQHKDLLIVDTVCNGVASPAVFKKYLACLSKNAETGGAADRGNDMGKTLRSYHFRNKKYEKGRGMYCRFNDGTVLEATHGKDRFCRMYMLNMVSRPSCAKCSFTVPARNSDITIGDFHGLEEIDAVFYKDGTSLVLPHTEKGRIYAQRICANGESKTYPIAQCMQPRLEAPAKAHMLRRFILKDYLSLPEEIFEKKYGKIL